MISVRLASQVSICGKDLNVAIFSDTVSMINGKLHDGSTHWALPIHTTFSDLGYISRGSYLITLNLCSYWLCQVDHEYTTVLECCTCSREIIDISLFEKQQSITLAFSQTALTQDRSNFACYSLAWGLHCHCRFDDIDIDHISRSQQCCTVLTEIFLFFHS